MNKTESREYVEKTIDDKFIEDVTKQPMSKEQREQAIADLDFNIAECESRIEQIQVIANFGNTKNNALDVLENESQNLIIEMTRKTQDRKCTDAIKSIKDATKILEHILFVKEKVQAYKNEVAAKKSAIKTYTASKEQLLKAPIQTKLV